jgi:DNA-binding response OmpR family regulator
MPVARVLLIEDELGLRTLIRQYLETQGHELVCAADGEEGLAKALAADFDLIICDLLLPRLSGQELCDELLRRRPELARRLVICTGDILSEDTGVFLARTGLPYITKPFGLREFAEFVKAHLRP